MEELRDEQKKTTAKNQIRKEEEAKKEATTKRISPLPKRRKRKTASLTISSKELLKMGAFSVARSFAPGSRCAVDKTIEETLMKYGKSKGGMGSGSGFGLGGILNNPSAYQRWIKTIHKRTQFKQMALGLVDQPNLRVLSSM